MCLPKAGSVLSRKGNRPPPGERSIQPILLETVGLDVEGQDLLTQLGIKMKEAWVDIVEEIAKEGDAASSLAKGSPMRYRRS